MTAEGAELLQAVKQMKVRRKGRVYTEEQLLAISARQSRSLRTCAAGYIGGPNLAMTMQLFVRLVFPVR
jgi:hypothetical protein